MTDILQANRVVPLAEFKTEELSTGGAIKYEYFPADLATTGQLLSYLFKERWMDVGIGHLVDGSVLELEFTEAPKICRLYDGYLTVVATGWHLHLCLAPHMGGADATTPPELRDRRLVTKAALYQRLNHRREARSWGIQFWNGGGEKMMNLFLPNPFVGKNEDLLPENRPDRDKLALYQYLRQMLIEATVDLPYLENPLQKPYLSVCRSTRCNPSGNWQSVFEALQTAVVETGLDIEVINSGCLEVCKMGPIAFYSGDCLQPTWYARVTPDVASKIVKEHVIGGKAVAANVYPSIKKGKSAENS
jgi:(2Fe-2S) ferredoxin